MPATALPGAQPGERWGALVCRPSAGLIYSRVCPSLMFAQREEEERGRASRVPPHWAGPAPRPSRQSLRPRSAARPLLVRSCVRALGCLFVLITRRVAGRHPGAVPGPALAAV